jgi:predicted branched-subunit amino acid permease
LIAMPDEYSAGRAFFAGLAATARSVFAYVLFGTFLGYGALCHDLSFSLTWGLVSSVLVWAGPAQVIVASSLGSGMSLVQAAIAVSLSGVRLLPMVVALLPMLKTERTRTWHLLLPAHFTAASFWNESLRLAPGVPRHRRIAFCNGLGVGFFVPTLGATVIGYLAAATFPPILAAALLFLTPMSFLVSTARNSRQWVDKLALALGLVLAPLFSYWKLQLDLLFAGLLAGTIAYAAHRLRDRSA